MQEGAVVVKVVNSRQALVLMQLDFGQRGQVLARELLEAQAGV